MRHRPCSRPLTCALAALTLALAPLALGACSGDDDGDDGGSGEAATTAGPSTTISDVWDAAGAERAEAVRAEVEAGGQGCTTDFSEYPRAQFLLTWVAFEWPIPLWAGRCTMTLDGEDLQIEIYADADAVAERIATKTEKLCSQQGFEGYSYVAGDDFVLTPDTIEGAEALAAIVGGTAEFASCPESTSTTAAP